MNPVAVSTRRRTDVPARSDILALASLLLGYPDDELLGRRAELAAAARELPSSPAAAALIRFIDWFAGLDARTAQSTYVETFDLRRRSSLYLTYYLHGDTRRRGAALVMVKQRYRGAGFVPADNELADYLPTALEFAAVVGPDRGEALLRSHRVGLEIIRQSLDAAKSPYTDVLDAVCTVVGDLGAQGSAEAEDLIRSGPPGELVGADLDPYPMTAPYSMAGGTEEPSR